jgi:hypothetical protein
MGDHILFTLLQLSDDKNNRDGLSTEMSGHVKEDIEAFAAKPYSDQELYDFLDKISQIPVEKFKDGDRQYCVGHISSFMQAVCNVKKYYNRPEDGEKKPLNKEECRKSLS